MPRKPANSSYRRFRVLLGHEFFAPAQWQRRLALWMGGVLVGLAAIAFAKLATLAYELFEYLLAISPYLPLVLTPVVFASLAFATRGRLAAARGSGIPEVIAAISVDDRQFRHRLLALPVALGKMLMTLVGLAAGASIGREGPTVHVGAGLMYWLGQRFGFDNPRQASRFILAGGGAGLAAAFNTPLAGIVFAIEELAGAYEHRVSGIILTTVIFAGVVSLGLMGNYSYFGLVNTQLPLGQSWLAVLLCGICGGIGGGLYSRLILLEHGPLARIAALRKRWPVWFALACGLALAAIGIVSGGQIYGTGYDQAHALVQATTTAPAPFGLMKLSANILSYWAGIPGGIFSPALTVGAGMGNTLANWLPAADHSAVVLLGMAAFLAGVTQTPITAAVISLELTANHNMVVPLLAVCLLARGISSLACRTPVYRAFAERAIAGYERASDPPEQKGMEEIADPEKGDWDEESRS